jgi:DNA-directed RNA polymerase subunit M/transcription elongation factor TFIIS
MKFNPGFRLSIIDIIVLLLGISLSVSFYTIIPLASFLILFVIGHFFLFCNIVRMSRIPELIWAGSFLLLAGSTLLYELLSWFTVAFISLMITSLLVLFEVCKPSYHGILWQQINPNLQQWYYYQQEKEKKEQIPEDFTTCRKCNAMMQQISAKNQSPLIMQCRQCGYKEYAEIQISPQAFFGEKFDDKLDNKSTHSEDKTPEKQSVSFFKPFEAPVSVGKPGEEQQIIPFAWILLCVIIIMLSVIFLFM